MSLTSHLRDPKSPIGQFIRQHCSQSSRITGVANPQLRSAGTINPGFEPWVYSHLGMAIDYRIRYFFAITPNEHLAAWYGVPMLAVKPWENDDDVPFHWENIPVGMSISLPGKNGNPFEVAQGPYSLELLLSFFDRLDTTLHAMQPVGRRLDLEEEQLLVRYSFILGLLEEPYRSGRYADGLLMVPTPMKSVDELLALPEDAWVDDLCTLSALFYDNYHHLFSLPFTLNPTFAGSSDVGGADADIIVDGCLIEIKSSIRARIDSSWLHQLIGYILLDYDDQQHFHSVGIYMARQGLLLTWPLIDFLRLLTGNDQISLAQLRREFRALCQRQSRRQKSMNRVNLLPTSEDQQKPRRRRSINRVDGHFPTSEEMQRWGYSQERIQWMLKNQQITKTMRNQGYSEHEITQKMKIMNPASKEDLQRMGFPEDEITILFPPNGPLGPDRLQIDNRSATKKGLEISATYARWLENYQCFELSTVPIPCYRCGEGTIASCSLCGVYVCNDCSKPDENDDSICFDCVAQGCKQGVHHHNTIWRYANEE